MRPTARRGPPGRHRSWLRGTVAGALLAAAAAGGVGWWATMESGTAVGSPRLLADRTDIDLGYLRFDQPARAAFTLANAGDGALRLAGEPRVVLRAGC